MRAICPRAFAWLLLATVTGVQAAEETLPEDYQWRGESDRIDPGFTRYAIDEPGKGAANFGVQPVHDQQVFAFLYVDRLEQRVFEGDDHLLWDLNGWVGNDYHKAVFKSEGEYNTSTGQYGESRNELLYGHPIAPFWDFQAGYRRDVIDGKDDRHFAVVGWEGMAPFAFEVDSALYLSSDGDLSARAEVEYSLRLTQRLLIIPRLETTLALQGVEEYGVGQGINGFDLGLRVAYQVTREFTPYLGVGWEQTLFETADLAEEAGEDTSRTGWVIGVKLVF